MVLCICEAEFSLIARPKQNGAKTNFTDPSVPIRKTFMVSPRTGKTGLRTDHIAQKDFLTPGVKTET